MNEISAVNVGRRFGRLIVLSEQRGPRSRRYLECRCDCGTEKTIRSDDVLRGVVVSCGCWMSERPRAKVHGYWNKPEYKIWHAMKARCGNPKDKAYYNYGGRGIRVCDAWLHDFSAFIGHIGSRPDPQHTLDRVDNSKGYEPGNVVWATRKEQQRNRRVNRILTYRGKAMCVTAWAEEVGLCKDTIETRLRLGWSTHEALTRPVLPYGQRKPMEAA